MHKLVYERARYLQRQERYDFVPWDETHGIRDDEFEKDVHALLLIEPPHIPVGVTSFSWKKMVKPAARLASEFHMDRRHMAQKRRCFAALAIMVANLRRFYH